MIISERVYYDILEHLSDLEHESGGILGGNDGVINRFTLDEGRTHYSDKYIPNVILMNQKIDEWMKDGMEFYGMVHNHLTNEKRLSNEDVIYIKRIMTSMPAYIDKLYFPLVIPNHLMVPFTAQRNDNNILLVNDILQII